MPHELKEFLASRGWSDECYSTELLARCEAQNLAVGCHNADEQPDKSIRGFSPGSTSGEQYPFPPDKVEVEGDSVQHTSESTSSTVERSQVDSAQRFAESTSSETQQSQGDPAQQSEEFTNNDTMGARPSQSLSDSSRSIGQFIKALIART